MTSFSPLQSRGWSLTTRRWLPALLVFTGLVLVAPEAMAQAADDDTAGEATRMIDQVLAAGGWMVPIAICSLMTLALVVLNSLQLTTKKFCPPDLKENLMANMQEVRVRSAIELASQSPTYLGRMMTVSLPFVDATDPETLGRERVEDAIAEFTVKENRPYMAWISYLSVLAQASPMLGLLGTVVGMVKAFATLSTTGGADPDALAGDISLALMTTMGGLIVAIPSVFAYYFFRNQLAKVVAACHEAAAEMIDAAIATVNADHQFAKVPEGLQGE